MSMENLLINEEWKQIKEHPNYEISSYGRIKSHTARKRGGLIKISSIDNCGYLHTRLCGRSYLVHRLVALHFVENSDNKPHINHKDGDKKNNKADNLEWCTVSENLIHAFETGLMTARTGERSNFSKITQVIADQIRLVFDESKNKMQQYDQLAIQFNLSQRQIRYIIKNKVWQS